MSVFLSINVTKLQGLIFISAFLSADIMQQFDHRHIIKLIGICSTTPVCIVMELARHGELRAYLIDNKHVLKVIINIRLSVRIDKLTIFLCSSFLPFYCIPFNFPLPYLTWSPKSLSIVILQQETFWFRLWIVSS